MGVQISTTRGELLMSPRDGTAAALVPLSIFSILFFVATLYISLDTGLHWTQAFYLTSTEDAEDLKGTALFVFSLILPAA